MQCAFLHTNLLFPSIVLLGCTGVENEASQPVMRHTGEYLRAYMSKGYVNEALALTGLSAFSCFVLALFREQVEGLENILM